MVLPCLGKEYVGRVGLNETGELRLFERALSRSFGELTIDVSSMESRPITVTWKYTMVGPSMEMERRGLR